MIYNLFKRGTGIFRIFFIIDDFFRVITLTILLPVAASSLGWGRIGILIALLIGLSMDIYDFAKEVGPGMSMSISSFNPVNIFIRKDGLKNFIFAVHDVIQMLAMTIMIPLALGRLGMPQLISQIGLVCGMVIDGNDFVQEFSSGKVDIDE